MDSELPTKVRALFPYESHFHDGGAARMHYVDEGQGEVVLCLHGNPTWSFMYRQFIEQLRRDYRVIVPDHIGCGLSDKPASYPYRLSQHMENVRSLISHLGISRFHLIAHDWGGAIGMGIAGNEPERLLSAQLMNTAAFPDARIPKRIALCKTPLLGALLVRGLNLFARGALILGARRRLPEEVARGYLFPYQRWRDRVGVHAFIKDIPMQPEHESYQQLVAIDQKLAKLVHVPIQLMWGMWDFCFDEHFLHRWMARFPRARVVRMRDAGHYVHEDESEACVRLSHLFLDRVHQRSS